LMKIHYDDIGLHVPNLLLPKAIDSRWPVIACDQFKLDRNYWKRVGVYVGESPSTLNLIYPEAYLPLDAGRVNRVHSAMKTYTDTVLEDKGPGLMLVERTTQHGTRKGLVVALDLEKYSYTDPKSLIRPTEGTIRDRLPARMDVRRGAALDMSHVLVLIDDPERSVIEPLRGKPAYDVELMEGGGRIKGYMINDESAISQIAELIAGLRVDPLYAVGDGNHSLAAAKGVWEELKAQGHKDHPARYALVELENIHDPGLNFQPIHRIVNNCDPELILKEFATRGWRISKERKGHAIPYVTRDGEGVLVLDKPTHDMETESLHSVLDSLNCEIEYEHDPELVESMGRKENAIGFHLPSLKKEEFFETIRKRGSFPRKTFSLGEEREKRYYLESRRLM